MPIYNGLKTVFVHIPKCAGSSMANFLYEENEKIGGLSIELEKHDSVRSLACLIPYNLYLKYFKFGFVRNPFDRTVSWYNYYQNLWANNKSNTAPCSDECISRFLEMNFDTWIKECKPFVQSKCQTDVACPFHFIANQYEYLIWHDQRIFVDFIGKFESIEDDWSVICQKIKLEDAGLPVLNSTKHGPYRDYYSDETKKIIEGVYAGDLRFFDYKF